MFSLLRRTTRSVTPPLSISPLSTAPQGDVAVVRQPADRTAHLDDQHLIFWNAETSRAAAAQLSEAAAAWQHAVAQQPACVPSELPRLTRP